MVVNNTADNRSLEDFGEMFDSSPIERAKRKLDFFDLKRTICLHHSDWDGIGGQAAFNKMCLEIKWPVPKFNYINYDSASQAIDFLKREEPENIIFIDYDAHELELKAAKQYAGRNIIIFDQHQAPELKELGDKGEITYINPIFSADERIGNSYVIWQLARLYGADVSLQALAGTVGYNNWRSAKKILEHTKLEKPNSKFLHDIILLTNYKQSNSHRTIDALVEAKDYDDLALKSLICIADELKLPEIYKRDLEQATKTAEHPEGTDLAVFTIDTDFEVIKPFINDLREYERKNNPAAIMYVQKKSCDVKVSLRRVRNKSLDLGKILDKTCRELNIKNYGGHPGSCGADFEYANLSKFKEAFTSLYKAQTQ